MSRLVRVALASLVTLTLTSSVVASCLPGDPKSSEEMACCKKGQHDCGPVMKAADCCKSSSSAPEKFIATKPAPPTKPILALSYLAQVIPDLSIGSSGPGTVVTVTRSSSPPLFLLTTAIRI